MRSPHGHLPAAPNKENQRSANQKEQHHAQQQTFRPESLSYGLGEKAGKDPTCDGAPTYHSEDPLGLPSCKDVVCQSPDLGWRQHPEDFHPDVEHRKQPGQMEVVMSEPPEHCAIAGKK